ncbi:hypothetical protein ACF0H5_021095 [Mactra antiquata]
MAERYTNLFELGAGAFGKALVVKDKVTNKKHVSKVIQIKGLSSKALDRCITEVTVLSACSHVNIVRYIQAFVNAGSLHIIMEYASGGDLLQKIEKQNGVWFTNDTILDWFLQVLLALEYIHKQNILHRDLKPQNIFLTYNDIIKLGDFGIARILNDCEDLAATRIGTPFYISPEICQRKPYPFLYYIHIHAGCFLYQLCMLHVPFHASNFDELTKIIVKAQYSPLPRYFNSLISHMISSLLVLNPKDRLSAKDLLKLDDVQGMLVYVKKKNLAVKSARSRSHSLVAKRSGLKVNNQARSNSVGRPSKLTGEKDNVIVPIRSGKEKAYKGVVEDYGVGMQDNIKSVKRHKDPETIKRKETDLEEDLIDRNNDIKGRRESLESHGHRKATIPDDRSSLGLKSLSAYRVNDSDKHKVGNGRMELVVDKVVNNVTPNACDDQRDKINGTKKKHGIKDRIDSERNLPDDEVLKKGGLTYTINDNFMRKLSVSSPRLAQTIHKQRFSLSISDPESLDVRKSSKDDIDTIVDDDDGVDGDDEDDVFYNHSNKPTSKSRNNSLTYTINNKGHKDNNNNNNDDDECTVCTENQVHKISQIMLKVLANKERSKKISVLRDEIVRVTGQRRCEYLLQLVNVHIVEMGQGIESLKYVVREDEMSYLPLIAMYLSML